MIKGLAKGKRASTIVYSGPSKDEASTIYDCLISLIKDKQSLLLNGSDRRLRIEVAWNSCSYTPYNCVDLTYIVEAKGEVI